jgi:hypothetical protein
MISWQLWTVNYGAVDWRFFPDLKELNWITSGGVRQLNTGYSAGHNSPCSGHNTAPVTTVNVPATIPNERNSKTKSHFLLDLLLHFSRRLPPSPLWATTLHVLVKGKHSVFTVEYGYPVVFRRGKFLQSFHGSVFCAGSTVRSQASSVCHRNRSRWMSRGVVLYVIAYSEQGLVRFVQCKAFLRWGTNTYQQYFSAVFVAL